MKPEVSLPHSQELSTYPYPEPDQYNIGLISEMSAELGGSFSHLCVSKDRLYGLVVRVPGYRSGGPDSSLGVTRFSEK
jgi:hypothetical protein